MNDVSENIDFVYTKPVKVTPKYAWDSFDEYETDDDIDSNELIPRQYLQFQSRCKLKPRFLPPHC